MLEENSKGYYSKVQEKLYNDVKIKKDCKSYRIKECDCLNELFCKTEICPFYKTNIIDRYSD